MKACGIVAEYNPFHKGHAYQIKKIKKESDAEVIIAVMSGNFLQRGEPAIVDKWTRSAMAVHSGVDLVVELPVIWSTQPADLFAKGAINILKDLNIDYLSFGSEKGKAGDFYEAAEYLNQTESKIFQKIEENEHMNMSYADKMQKVILKLNPDFPLDLSLPNTQLGLSYQRELFNLGLENKVKLLPIKRIGSSYREERIDRHPEIASATAIRRAIFGGKSYSSYLKKSSLDVFNRNLEQKVSWENYFPLLKYQLFAKSKSDLREIYQMTEGLENRLKKFIKESENFEEFISKIKTKRYTRTRLQRLLIYVLLNIKADDVRSFSKAQNGIRILAFNKKGQLYLNQEKNIIDKMMISNVNRKTKKYLGYEIKSGQIYRLGNPSIKKQDFSRKPLIFD